MCIYIERYGYRLIDRYVYIKIHRKREQQGKIYIEIYMYTYTYISISITMKRSFAESHDVKRLMRSTKRKGYIFIYLYRVDPYMRTKPLSDQFPVRVCSCPLCIINRLWISIYLCIQRVRKWKREREQCTYVYSDEEGFRRRSRREAIDALNQEEKVFIYVYIYIYMYIYIFIYIYI